MIKQKLRIGPGFGIRELTDLGEGLDLATVAGSTLSWKET